MNRSKTQLNEDFPEFPEIPQLEQVQKVNKYAAFEYLIEADETDKLAALNILLSSLNVRSIQSEADKLGKSYNGVKNFGKTIKIVNKLFVYG